MHSYLSRFGSKIDISLSDGYAMTALAVLAEVQRPVGPLDQQAR